MFTNVGHKIQVLAKVICWIGIGLSIITGIGVIISGVGMISTASSYRSYSYYSSSYSNYDTYGALMIIGGIIWIGIGAFLSWIASFRLYAYGVIAENTDALTTLTMDNAKQLDRIAKTVARIEMKNDRNS